MKFLLIILSLSIFSKCIKTERDACTSGMYADGSKQYCENAVFILGGATVISGKNISENVSNYFLLQCLTQKYRERECAKKSAFKPTIY